MRFQREIVTLPFLSECAKLFLAHHLEVSHNPEMALDPDPQQYVTAEEMGLLRWFTLRTDEGEIVGYFSFVVSQFLHHVKHKQAHQNLLFIRQDYRGEIFPKFMYLCLIKLKEEGIEKVYVHANPKNALHHYFERQGFELVDRVYEAGTEEYGPTNFQERLSEFPKQIEEVDRAHSMIEEGKL